MEANNILKLVLISTFLLISIHASEHTDSPAPSPAPQSDDTSISLAPKSSDSPSKEPTASEKAPAPLPDDDSSEIGDESEEQRLEEDDVDPKVKKICDSTDHPNLCMATVVPLLKGKTNHKAVLQVAIKAGRALAKQALTQAKELVGEPETYPELESVLKECKESYSTVVENYDKTIDALSEGDIGTMETMLSAAITNIGDCQDAVEGKAITIFSKFGDKLTNMTSNCLAIISFTK